MAAACRVVREAQKRQNHYVVLAEEKILLQRHNAEKRQEQKSAPSDLSDAPKRNKRNCQQNQIENEPRALGAERRQAGQRQQRCRAQRRMRRKTDQGLIDLRIVFVALKPSPLIGAIDRNPLAMKRSRQKIVWEIGVHGAPG